MRFVFRYFEKHSEDMRTLSLLLLLSVFSLRAQTDFQKVKSDAAQQGKYILLNFSGSDWCGPCIVFTREFLGNADYRSLADSRLVFVNADFPRKKKNQLSSEAAKANDGLAEKYNPKGIFPYTLLLDANGKVVKAWEGKPSVSPSEWVTELQALCKR
jgi:thioredoxin-related protein